MPPKRILPSMPEGSKTRVRETFMRLTEGHRKEILRSLEVFKKSRGICYLFGSHAVDFVRTGRRIFGWSLGDLDDSEAYAIVQELLNWRRHQKNQGRYRGD